MEISPQEKFKHRRSHFIFILILLLTQSVFESKLAAQEPKPTDVRELQPGSPIQRELAGGNSHSYLVRLTSKQYLEAVVKQKGIDTVVQAFGPAGQKLTEVDNTGGRETVFLIAESSGDYRVEVRTADKEAKAGAYEIAIVEVREANEKDRVTVAAQKLFEEGNQLRDKRTAESRRTAIKKYEEALPLWRNAGAGVAEVRTLNEIGVLYATLGEPKKGVEYFLQALPLLSAAGDQAVAANTLTNLGTTYWISGELQKALGSHNQALPLARAAGESQIEGAILSNTGSVYWSLGQPQKALEYYNPALLIARARGDRRRQAITLNNMATAHQQLGDLQLALEAHTQGIALRRAVGDRQGEAASLNNLALVYSSLGDLQKASEYYNQALVIRREGGDRQAQATNLQGLSSVNMRIGELATALKYGNEALTLARAVSDRRLEAYVLDVLGRIHQRSQEPAKALEIFEQSLSIRRSVEDGYGETYTLNKIGNSYLELGNPQKALDYYRQSLELSRKIGDRLGEASTLLGIARSHSRLGDNVSAQKEIEEALAVVESTRIRLPSQDFRSSFLASYQDYYQFYIDLLMRMHKDQPAAGNDVRAFAASERARARSLIELLTEAKIDVRQGVAPELLERQLRLQQDLNSKAEQQVRLLSRKHTTEQAAAKAKEIEGVIAEYEQALAEIRQTSPRYATLTQPQPLDLREIQQRVLDENTLLLEYALGEERSYLWAVTPTSIKGFTLPGRIEIEARTREVYEAITARNKLVRFEKPEDRQVRIDRADKELLSASAILSDVLLGPVASQLGKKRLVIVSEGALQYLPFGALPLPSAKPVTGSRRSAAVRPSSPEPLIINHEIVSLPSVSVLPLLRKEISGRSRATRSLAVLADPVFQNSDPRVKGEQSRNNNDRVVLPGKEVIAISVDTSLERSARDVNEPEFRRLPHSRAEANGIVAFSSRVTSRKSLDFEANRAAATSGELSDYRIIHFATHGFLNSQHPELSGIVLSLVDEKGNPQNGFLRLNEIYNLKLSADLVVLSACRTALGKEIRGEGLVGLTRGFMYAGAPRVVASLWAVDDETTAELMKRFYREMLVNKQRPAAALRAAQVGIWKERRLPPYFWSAFVLQGEWK